MCGRRTAISAVSSMQEREHWRERARSEGDLVVEFRSLLDGIERNVELMTHELSWRSNQEQP